MPLTGYDAERRHPAQVALAVAVMLSGVAVLTVGPASGSLAAALPPLLLTIWASLYVVGGAGVVLAALARPLPALYLELAASGPLALTSFSYTTALFVVAGGKGLVASLLVCAIGVTYAVRLYQSATRLIRYRRLLGAHSADNLASGVGDPSGRPSD
jgi:hypothetical protein